MRHPSYITENGEKRYTITVRMDEEDADRLDRLTKARYGAKELLPDLEYVTATTALKTALREAAEREL